MLDNAGDEPERTTVANGGDERVALGTLSSQDLASGMPVDLEEELADPVLGPHKKVTLLSGPDNGSGEPVIGRSLNDSADLADGGTATRTLAGTVRASSLA